MNANPYAAFLEGRDAVELVRATPAEIERLVELLGEEGLKRSLAPGKWTARLILCHLADTEIAFSFRLRQALAEEKHVVQPFDQDAWARRYRDELPAEKAVKVFSTLRDWNTSLIEGIPADDWEKPLNHPERGEMTFRTLVETMAGHDQNHLRQLEQLAQQ